MSTQQDVAGMRTVRTVAELRALLQVRRRDGARIGLVPTMGAFHDGHLALMRAAREECDVIVVSLFVNPTQFGDPADLAAYPRNDTRDEALASEAGVDVLFAPPVGEVYPAGFDTVVQPGAIAEPLEGLTRGPSHFRGVATVVAKLFNMVQPHVACFGQKDYQQTRVIQRLVYDLDMTVELVVHPTVREHDGLAMSSRNARLAPAARIQAVALHEALQTVEQSAARGERSVAALLAAASAQLTARGIPASDVEYFAGVDVNSLQPVVQLAQPVLFAVAARVGGVRLIDNIILAPAS